MDAALWILIPLSVLLVFAVFIALIRAAQTGQFEPEEHELQDIMNDHD